MAGYLQRQGGRVLVPFRLWSQALESVSQRTRMDNMISLMVSCSAVSRAANARRRQHNHNLAVRRDGKITHTSPIFTLRREPWSPTCDSRTTKAAGALRHPAMRRLSACPDLAWRRLGPLTVDRLSATDHHVPLRYFCKFAPLLTMEFLYEAAQARLRPSLAAAALPLAFHCPLGQRLTAA